MDALDIALLRGLHRDPVFAFGSRDPRLSGEALAKKLGVARSTVRARLKRWAEDGFLVKFVAWPHLALLGAESLATGVRVPDPRDKPRVVEALGLVEGVVYAIEHVGEWVGLLMADDGTPGVARRLKLLGKLPGVAETQDAFRAVVPPPTTTPTPLDWRILREIVKSPRMPLGEVARAVGVSARTLTRRYEALVKGGALWSFPIVDFTRYEGGVATRLIARFRKGVDPGLAMRAVRAALPGAVAEFPAPGEVGGPRFLDLIVHARTVGEAEAASLQVAEVSGVEEVEMLFPTRMHVFPGWVEERVGEKA